MIWNRKEVFVTHSLPQFNRVRDYLDISKVENKYRVFNRNSAYLIGSRRARTGSFGEKFEHTNTYYIYVHKKNYEIASSLLKRIKFE